MWTPPMGRTAVCTTAPSTKTATSVVPPPMSTITTPCCISSRESTASADASGSRMSDSTRTPAPSMHCIRLCIAEEDEVTTCVSTSSREPNMPPGSMTWSWPSTT